jgi:hypothetical protein
MTQGQPTELNFPFLERLNLRTLVWLAPEEPNQRLYVLCSFFARKTRVTRRHRERLCWCKNSLNFLDDQEIRLHHLGVINATNAWDPLTEEVVLQALYVTGLLLLLSSPLPTPSPSSLFLHDSLMCRLFVFVLGNTQTAISSSTP